MNTKAILNHIELWVQKLGSAAALAKRLNISDATLSQIRKGTYGADTAKILGEIAAKLDYRAGDWQMVRTTQNYRAIETVVRNAKSESLWLVVSNPAGSGKTAALQDLYNADTTGSIVFMQCEEWSARQFLIELTRRTLGEAALKGKYQTISELIQKIATYFNERQFTAPLLIIDEADKLRPAALRTLIPLYNKTEDRLGLVMSGTENLQKEIEAGVRLRRKGYDEIESRLGRTYVKLLGATKQDVQAICQANGLTSPERIEQIWEYELEKVEKIVKVKQDGNTYERPTLFAEDLRRLKRIIKREKLMQQ